MFCFFIKLVITFALAMAAHDVGHWIVAKAFRVENYKWGLWKGPWLKDLPLRERITFTLSGVTMNLMIAYFCTAIFVWSDWRDLKSAGFLDKVVITNRMYVRNIGNTAVFLAGYTGLKDERPMPMRHRANDAAVPSFRKTLGWHLVMIRSVNVIVAIVSLVYKILFILLLIVIHKVIGVNKDCVRLN